MQFHSAIKRSKLLICTIWMNLNSSLLTQENPDTKDCTLDDSICEITARAVLKWQKVDQCLPRARGSGTGSDCNESKNVSRWWKHSVRWLWWWLYCHKSLSEFLFCAPKCGEFIVYKYTPIQLTERKKNTFTPGPTPESPLGSDLLTTGYEECVTLSHYLMLQSPFPVETPSAVMLWMVSW